MIDDLAHRLETLTKVETSGGATRWAWDCTCGKSGTATTELAARETWARHREAMRQ